MRANWDEHAPARVPPISPSDMPRGRLPFGNLWITTCKPGASALLPMQGWCSHLVEARTAFAPNQIPKQSTYQNARQVSSASSRISTVNSPSSCLPNSAEQIVPTTMTTTPTTRRAVRDSPSVYGAESAFHTVSSPPNGASSDCAAKAYAQISRTGEHAVLVSSPSRKAEARERQQPFTGPPSPPSTLPPSSPTSELFSGSTSSRSDSSSTCAKTNAASVRRARDSKHLGQRERRFHVQGLAGGSGRHTMDEYRMSCLPMVPAMVLQSSRPIPTAHSPIGRQPLLPATSRLRCPALGSGLGLQLCSCRTYIFGGSTSRAGQRAQRDGAPIRGNRTRPAWRGGGVRGGVPAAGSRWAPPSSALREPYW